MIMKCSYCGKKFDLDILYAPTHDFPPPCRSVCPGSGKLMLKLTSKKKLGKT